MDVSGIATRFAGELIAHRTKLEGKAGEAQNAQTALESAAKAIEEQRDAHRKAAQTLLSRWESNATAGFQKRTDRFDRDLELTAQASTKGAKIVAEVYQALEGRHNTVGNIVEEFITTATKLLQSGLAAAGITAPAGLMRAVAQVADLAGSYIKQSGGELKDARDEMVEAARKLRALQREVDSDGVADPRSEAKQPGKDTGKGEGGQKGKDERKGSAKAEKILENARKHLGYHEGANNRNKWGPTGQPWCSYFATSMWQDAGVDIPKYGFSGDVYKWGEKHGTAYDADALAKQARPGDALLFGSGPDSPATSKHIGIIEKVEGNKITTIEGNSGDQVARRTYTLPKDADKFYGGVHPK
ncbi:CHAP domain-containing protein [Saccharopolyspora thermophila]|uniref:Peptidase C51 domain-containing protein n=1 Tax=Saccharopolyspora thermophila TaxID=89367 RepID=A0ABN1CFS3_9PSEU